MVDNGSTSHKRLTWLLEMPDRPIAVTTLSRFEGKPLPGSGSSTERVEMP